MTCNRLKEFTEREGTVSLAYMEHPELKSHVENCKSCREFEKEEHTLDHLISMGRPALPHHLPPLITNKPIWYQPFWGIAAMIFIAAFIIYQNMPNPDQNIGLAENVSPEMAIVSDKDLEKIQDEFVPQPANAPVEREAAREAADKAPDGEGSRTEERAVSALHADRAPKQKQKEHIRKPKREKITTHKGRASSESTGDNAVAERPVEDRETGFKASPVSPTSRQPEGHIPKSISSPAISDTIYEKKEDMLSEQEETMGGYRLEEEIAETNLYKKTTKTDSIALPPEPRKAGARSKKTTQRTMIEELIVMNIEIHEPSTRTSQEIVHYDLTDHPSHRVMVTILAIPSGGGSPFSLNQTITLGTKNKLKAGKAILTLRLTGNQKRPFDMIKVEY